MRTIQEHNLISVIIPTLDAAAELPRTLGVLAGVAHLGEVIVVDGGSRDASLRIARRARARVIAAPRGRGTQLAAGAKAARCNWLLFLHADSRPLPGWDAAVRVFIAAPGAEMRAGYFTLALDDPTAAARRVERLAELRCRALALPYGDQGLLIHRSLYQAAGGYPAIPLMEDVALARRLGRARLKPLGATILTSPSRYRRDGYWRRPLRNLLCLSLYFLGLPPGRIVRLYG